MRCYVTPTDPFPYPHLYNVSTQEAPETVAIRNSPSPLLILSRKLIHYNKAWSHRPNDTNINISKTELQKTITTPYCLFTNTNCFN